MFLADTNVISEARKGVRANPGVQRFFATADQRRMPLYLSVVTIGELQRVVERIRYRGDRRQADQLDQWLERILVDYADSILGVDGEVARVWGSLRAPHSQHALDKLIAATALLYDLTVVTRNQTDFEPSMRAVLNPFE